MVDLRVELLVACLVDLRGTTLVVMSENLLVNWMAEKLDLWLVYFEDM